MVMLKKTIAWIATLTTVFAVSFLLISHQTTAYHCRTDECRAARDNMNKARADAKAASLNAKSVAQVIAQLNAEIIAVEAQIAINEAAATDFAEQIKATEIKLQRQQIALAKLLVDIHFDQKPDTVFILAGSNSISELTERQSRQSNLKQQVAASAREIQQTKKSLEDKKAEVERIILAQESERALIATKRNQQNALKADYEQSANEALALARHHEEELKQLAYTPPSTGSGWGYRNYNRSNTYGKRNNCPADNNAYGAYGGNVCQCTSYALYKAYEKWGWSTTIVNPDQSLNPGCSLENKSKCARLGHARHYITIEGYTPKTDTYLYVDRVPEAHTIAIDTTGSYGHVMWVESVNEDGTINVSEYNVNWPSVGCRIGGFCSRDKVGTAKLHFLHFSK